MRLRDRGRKRRRERNRKAGIRTGTCTHGEEKNTRKQAREIAGKKRPMPISTKNWKRKNTALVYRRQTEDEKKEGQGAGHRHLERKKKGELEDRPFFLLRSSLPLLQLQSLSCPPPKITRACLSALTRPGFLYTWPHLLVHHAAVPHLG